MAALGRPYFAAATRSPSEVTRAALDRAGAIDPLDTFVSIDRAHRRARHPPPPRPGSISPRSASRTCVSRLAAPVNSAFEDVDDSVTPWRFGRPKVADILELRTPASPQAITDFRIYGTVRRGRHTPTRAPEKIVSEATSSSRRHARAPCDASRRGHRPDIATSIGALKISRVARHLTRMGDGAGGGG